MLGWPRKDKYKADEYDEDNPRLENEIQLGERKTEEESRWNEGGIENPNCPLENSKESFTSRKNQVEDRKNIMSQRLNRV